MTETATPTATVSPPAPETLESAYRARYARFVAVAAGITGDADSGREAVQEAFARMLAAGPPRDADLGAWTWVCVVNAAREARRRRVRRERWSRAVAAPPERPAPEAADAPDPAVRAAVADLPERQRTALFLRHHADLDYATIGRVMGISTGAVGATISAAHAALRARLDATGEGK